MYNIECMVENVLLVAEKRICVAKSIILKAVPSLDMSNTFGIVGFGSFWSRDIKRKAVDIDLAVYVQNDAVFNDSDRLTIEEPLRQQFGIGIETHVITPYTIMVTHEASNYKIILKERVAIWGSLPNWVR